jgi:hypothetical protein
LFPATTWPPEEYLASLIATAAGIGMEEGINMSSFSAGMLDVRFWMKLKRLAPLSERE